jgi:hypothetical protein
VSIVTILGMATAFSLRTPLSYPAGHAG